jgi:hypothetical protein
MFKIDNVEKFAMSMISIAFDASKRKLSDMTNRKEDELNSLDFIKLEEAVLIVNYIISKYNANNYQKIPDKIATLVSQDLINRFLSNCLHDMANKGYVDCAFSDKEDAFVFKLTKEGEKMGMNVLDRIQ